MKVVLLCLTLFFFYQVRSQVPGLIPKPASTRIGTGNFVLTEKTVIYPADSLSRQDASVFADLFARSFFFRPKIAEPGQKAGKGIQLVRSSKNGYVLDISPGLVKISGDADGIFHGLISLLQMTDSSGNGKALLPVVRIIDSARFSWRGMHLDVCRHFFPVEFIKKYIDLLALHKMNTFHWHLTEDQGWRIQVSKYPLLTEKGSSRSGTMAGHYREQRYDSIPVGGYYTREDIREIVRYAAARHITVVPEIEMPGHSLAALAAYPELSCTGGPFEVARGWGVFEDVYCAGKEETFLFLEDVLAEVIELFPSRYIHIGGDECPKSRWKSCSACQGRMKAEGLKDEHELQSYFIRRIEKFVNSKGRQIIGWDEILEGGLAPNAAVMSWRGTEGGIAAAEAGHFAVMSPGSHCYFDHYQADPATQPLAIGGLTPLEKVYSYHPVPEALRGSSREKFILGAQGNVWTEYISTPEQVEYMALPRMAALAEVLWGTAGDYAEFTARLRRHLGLLDHWKVNYCLIPE